MYMNLHFTKLARVSKNKLVLKCDVFVTSVTQTNRSTGLSLIGFGWCYAAFPDKQVKVCLNTPAGLVCMVFIQNAHWFGLPGVYLIHPLVWCTCMVILLVPTMA